jgi:DNA modification methylase
VAAETRYYFILLQKIRAITHSMSTKSIEFLIWLRGWLGKKKVKEGNFQQIPGGTPSSQPTAKKKPLSDPETSGYYPAYYYSFFQPGDLVLDFFAGSGTIGVVCAEMGRDCILIDNNPEAIKIMKQRLGQDAECCI